MLSREEIREMPFSLETIIHALSVAFENIPSMYETIVLAIGGTGAGKSTLITAYIDGPKSLHETKIEMVTNVGPQKKERKRM